MCAKKTLVVYTTRSLVDAITRMYWELKISIRLGSEMLFILLQSQYYFKVSNLESWHLKWKHCSLQAKKIETHRGIPRRNIKVHVIF
jgi:hypothetical protein